MMNIIFPLLEMMNIVFTLLRNDDILKILIKLFDRFFLRQTDDHILKCIELKNWAHF